MPARQNNCCNQTGAEESDDSGSAPSPGPADEPGAESSTDADGDQPPPAGGDAAPQVVVCNHSARAVVDEAWLVSRLREVIGHVGRPVQRIEISVLSDRQMAAVHRRHCGIDETTDVLTFPLSAPDAPIEAELLVCVDEAARQAGSFNIAVERELLLYCLHGLLHCTGFNDHEPGDFDAMHAREDEILEAIGVGATFHGDRSDHDDDRRPSSRDRGTTGR